MRICSMRTTFKSIFAKEMTDYLKLVESADKEVKNYRVNLGQLDRYIVQSGSKEKALTESFINDWLKTLNVTPKTKSYAIARIRKFARYLTALEIQAYEPEYNRVSSNYRAYTFTDEEFAAIIEAADNFRASNYKFLKLESTVSFPILLRILYGCGLRIGEAVVLKWEDINLDNGIITVKKSKYDKQRCAPMTSSLTEILQLFKKKQTRNGRGTGYLFENLWINKPYTDQAFRFWFLKLLQQTNISNDRTVLFERLICPHTLRHYFTLKSFLKSQSEGRSLEETAPYLSAYLGHETFFGTEKYLTSDYTVYTDSQERRENAIGSIFPMVSFE